ncbi:M3 family oligoendopeptidase [Aquirufa sp. 5-AUSEE-100C1]
MTRQVSAQNITRKFLAKDFQLSTWESVLPYFEQLSQTEINSLAELIQFCENRSELESYLSENFAWRYIKMSCDNQNEAHQKSYQQFVNEIMPQASVYDDAWNKKIIESPFHAELPETGYPIMLRGMKKSIEIFREENIPLFTELQNLQTQYGAATGALMVEIDGEEKTLQQANAYFESTDRSKRHEVYEKVSSARLEIKEKLDELFNQLVEKRHQVALNAGFANYRDYAFASLGRFDYSPADCFEFHDAVAATVVPIINEQAEKRKKALQLGELKPWDKAVDTLGRKPLKPFETGQELLDKTIHVFHNIDPFLSDCLKEMVKLDRFDLDSRKGKNPGGYNYPLEESGFPFIFMNAAGQVRDMVTLLHEGGHAVHSILTKDLALNAFRNFPSEVAELASMSMELITMDEWDHYFEDPKDAKRAKIKHLEDILETLPWVATIDAFQHWIYENPNHSIEERSEAWERIYSRFSDSITDWKGLETAKAKLWQKQLHLFEVPFYYIEYAIAQLGALAVWRNYCANPAKALDQYLNALSLGYTKPMKEIYATAGISFDFSQGYIAELMAFLVEKIHQLEES